MSKDTTFDKIQKHLFEDSESASVILSDHELEIKKRYVAVFTLWLENPQYTDKDMVNYILTNFDINKSQAYRDIPRIKLMMGNVQNATKEWQRYTVIEMLKEAYKLAEKQLDSKAMSYAADKIGKYTMLDKIAVDQIPWDQMIPPNFEPSSDISILKIEKDPNLDKKVARMKKKYLDDVDHIEDAEIVEE